MLRQVGSVPKRFQEGRNPRHPFPDGWPSGQRQQTVNLSGYALRRFESFPVHHIIPKPESDPAPRYTFQEDTRQWRSRSSTARSRT